MTRNVSHLPSPPVPAQFAVPTRREWLRVGLSSMFGWSLTELLAMRAASANRARSFGRAKSCIVLFGWGGISHIDTFDLKPEAEAGIRGEFKPISTSVPGIHVGEHLPLLAQHMHRLAVVRSVHHQAGDHRMAAYWNLTGHVPPGQVELGVAPPLPPSRRDWPCLGSMVAKALAQRTAGSPLPATVTLPYPIADRGLQNGQYGGFLGAAFDPAFCAPKPGRRYAGVSAEASTLELTPIAGMTTERMTARRTALRELTGARRLAVNEGTRSLDQYQSKALDLLLAPSVRAAFDLEREPASLRERYGDHICGQSVLLARRLTEAGVPLITVFCSAGDLNSGNGDHFDTHGDNFNRLKRGLLPPLDRASAALLQDLHERGTLAETLIVWLTEFGRTPRINGSAGRDHFPDCYSVAFAGAGVRGGQVFGRSDQHAAAPVESPCTPADLHATIFHALGIDPESQIVDLEGRPQPLTDGRPLPLF